MKIGYFCYRLSGTGPRTRAADIINAVAEKSDHEVVVLTNEPDKVTEAAVVNPVSIRNPIEMFRTTKRCFSDADIVHVPVNVYQVMFVRALYHGPLVGGVGPGIQSSLLHRYLGRLLGIDKKIKVHEGDRRWEAVGYDTEICTATINTNQFYRYDDERKREIRHKYGFSQDQIVVLYVGKLTEYKGAHIVDEMARLARGDDSLHFLVVGVGPMEDRFHDRENIEYEGFVENDSMPDRYNLADVTVAPREDDNTSNVGLESIACGTPVITTATGDIEDLFRDSGTYVWADRSPEAVLETVNELVLDSTRYENQVKRGLNTIEERELTLDSALKTHLEVYRDIATASVDTKPNSKADASQ